MQNVLHVFIRPLQSVYTSLYIYVFLKWNITYNLQKMKQHCNSTIYLQLFLPVNFWNKISDFICALIRTNLMYTHWEYHIKSFTMDNFMCLINFVPAKKLLFKNYYFRNAVSSGICLPWYLCKICFVLSLLQGIIIDQLSYYPTVIINLKLISIAMIRLLLKFTGVQSYRIYDRYEKQAIFNHIYTKQV
jgi:hypothetical protein